MEYGKIQRLSEDAFKPFGKYFRAEEKDVSEICADYQEMATKDAVVERPLKFGITCCENGDEFKVDSMERHLSSEEVQFACEKSVILSVANSDPWEYPKTEDVASFLLEPGDVVVLNRGIWHDACHATGERTMYYFLSYTNRDPMETTWVDVKPEPVWVRR